MPRRMSNYGYTPVRLTQLELRRLAAYRLAYALTDGHGPLAHRARSLAAGLLFARWRFVTGRLDPEHPRRRRA